MSLSVHVNTPKDLQPQCIQLANLCNSGGLFYNVISDLKAIMTNLESNWKGVLAQETLNDIIKVYNAMYEFRTTLGNIALAANEAAVKIDRVNHSRDGLYEATATCTVEAMPSSLDKRDEIAVDQNQQFDIQPAASESLANLNTVKNRIQNELQTQLSKITSDIFGNWTVGDERGELESAFNNYFGKFTEYYSSVNNAYSNLSNALTEMENVG